MPDVLFVSVNQSFHPDFTLSELESCVERTWPLTVAKAARCDRVVAIVAGHPVGAWRIRGAFATDETYRVNTGKDAPRVGLSLGYPLLVLPEYVDPASLRRGVAVVKCDVDPLPKERGREN